MVALMCAPGSVLAQGYSAAILASACSSSDKDMRDACAYIIGNYVIGFREGIKRGAIGFTYLDEQHLKISLNTLKGNVEMGNIDDALKWADRLDDIYRDNKQRMITVNDAAQCLKGKHHEIVNRFVSYVRKNPEKANELAVVVLTNLITEECNQILQEEHKKVLNKIIMEYRK